MQVQVNPTFYQSFGGINFMENDFRSNRLPELIDQSLGMRSLTAQYNYADVIKSLFYMFSIGGNVLDDLNTLRQQLKDQPSLKACSPDTVEYVCQELRQPIKKIITDNGVIHQINEHDNFSKLLSALSLYGGALNTKDSYTLDYDGHIVKNTKTDNARNYKYTDSYYPVVLSIQKLPVYIQNRNGNTPESYGQLNLITKTVNQCRSLGLKLKKFRADACCYEKQTIEYLEQSGLTYYIRAEMNAGLRIALEDEPEWQSAKFNNKKVEVCSIEEKLFGSKTYRRVVAYRYKVKGQLNFDDVNGYRYYAIITNGTEEAAECITFYNQRGCEGEHHFKELDHDFGWNKLPFDNMEMNTVYMYATAICYLLFNIFKKRYAAKTSFVNIQMRLKNFVLHFVTLPARWIKTGRRHVLKIFTTKNYYPLFSP